MDSVTFLGPRVPQEIRKVYPLLSVWKEKELDGVLSRVVATLKGDEEMNQDDFEIFAGELGVSIEQLATVFTGLFYLVRSAVRSKVKDEIIQKDLSEDLKFPPFIVGRILTIVRKFQKDLEASLLTNGRIRNAHLEEMKWRVDVCVSSNSQARILQPSILMEMYSSDGKRQQFEVSVEKFQDLRYQVARVLKNMDDLEKQPILKIIDKK
eukprot:TRINITY_DN1133_c0_g1_i1.p1 TRINITY_DN1133_c0_g1~~TRINITY_DN1133_c0_g1_i1.p1  ORF type:complete len:209 (-),score=79.23 TRINITY_DN1133_c0_g1_i1:243-869(-)